MPTFAWHRFAFSDDDRRAVDVDGTVIDVSLNGLVLTADEWRHQGGILMLLRDKPQRGDVLNVQVVE